MNNAKGIHLLNRIVLLFISCLLFSTYSYAQSEWTPLTDSAGVSISYQETICNNKPCVLIKMSNTNDATVTLNWSALNGGPVAAFTLQPNSTATGSCNGTANLVFTLIPGYDVTSFVKSFRITTIN